MTSVHVIRRKRKHGWSYHVRYRLGGAAYPLVHAGAFKTKREAMTRRDFVAGELAAGRDPREAIKRLGAPKAKPRTVAEAADAWLASRIDVAPNTLHAYRHAVDRFSIGLGDVPVGELTQERLQAWVASASTINAPRSVRHYVRTLAQVLDYAGADPNPARNVRLPRVATVEPTPMTRNQLHVLLDTLTPRWRLPVRLLEATGLRVGELAALTWGDVDVHGSRVRVSRARTKSRSGQRFAKVPAVLMGQLDALLPREDRVENRRVFPGLDPRALATAMRRACRTAGLPHFTPHDLRHRRLSLWSAQGMSPRELAMRAGHSRPTVTLDVYAHVIAPDDDEWSGDD